MVNIKYSASLIGSNVESVSTFNEHLLHTTLFSPDNYYPSDNCCSSFETMIVGAFLSIVSTISNCDSVIFFIFVHLVHTNFLLSL